MGLCGCGYLPYNFACVIFTSSKETGVYSLFVNGTN
jgi:hypothetical protein